MKTIPTPKLATADVCDAMGEAVSILPIVLNDYGGRLDFAGPAVTLRTLDDNSMVKNLVETAGEDRVLVVDGGGSMRSALLGGNLAAAAAKNGWAGLLIYGCVRDLHELCAEDVGIKALGSCPRKSEKMGRGEVDVEVAFDGVVIKPGYWVIADSDGVVISPEIPSL